VPTLPVYASTKGAIETMARAVQWHGPSCELECGRHTAYRERDSG
jgi:hypothetical protein